MRRIMKTICGALAGLAMGITPVLSQQASPAGNWLIASKDSLYNVTMCGGGDVLCARLVWLGGGADNAENRPYLNTYLIEGARPAGRNRWQGTLHVFGQSAPGTIKLVNADRIELNGCVFFVVCRTYVLDRVK